MRRELADQVAPPIYAAVDFVLLVAPALAVKLAADRGGMGDAEGVDLIVVSSLLGVGHAAVAWFRLRSEEHMAVRRADMWIASIDALIVLGLGAVLLMGVLYRYADEHASLADRGYPVFALWGGVQLVAIALAEVTGRFVFWWLEPHAARRERRHRARHERRRRLTALR